jgi:hypothetical protein
MSLVDERPRVDERSDELERVWRLPGPVRSRRLLPARGLVMAIPWLWAAGLVFLLAFAPAANPDEALPPLWVELVVSGFWLTLMVGSVLAAARHTKWALGTAVLAGGLGAALGYACRATGHHIGSWWLVETVVFAVLGVLSLAALAGEVRRLA